MKRIWFFAGAFVVLLLMFVFTYRLTEIPPGLTDDEAALGKNAVLLSRTLHDQNDRFLPVFTMSQDNVWYQPVTQYYLTAFFKVFGASVFNLRLASVLVAVLSAVLVFYLGYLIGGKGLGVVSSLIFLTAPLTMIHAHLAQENIMSIPFAILWLIFILFFGRKKKLRYLLLSGISLGVGFYAYKGMRGVVPVWFLLTIGFLTLTLLKERSVSGFKKILQPIAAFGLGIAPFMLAIPFLEARYPGAVFDRQPWNVDSIYDFMYPYLSTFDLSFLFIKGDLMLIHSTQRHGVFLLAALPLFIIGCFQVFKEKKIWYLVLAAFFLAPLLFGLVNSTYRASRLLALVPLFSLLSGLGAMWLWRLRGRINYGGWLIGAAIFLFVLNYADFVRYYWGDYPLRLGRVTTENYRAYEALAFEAKRQGLKPFVSQKIVESGESERFFEMLYFENPVPRRRDNEVLPPGSILLTVESEIPGMERVDVKIPEYSLQMNPQRD